MIIGQLLIDNRQKCAAVSAPWGEPSRPERPVAVEVGVVGAGFIGAVHARAARRAGARLVGVAASTPASTEEAAARLGAERAFADGETLVASPDVDVVHICTPNHLHAPLAEPRSRRASTSCARSRWPLDLADRRRAASRRSPAGVVATVPFVYRFYPMVREARARVADGVGPCGSSTAATCRTGCRPSEDDNWRVDAALAGPSRAFADIGSHWCDLVEFVTGDRLAAVCAELVTAVPERASAASTSTPSDRARDPAGHVAGRRPPRTWPSSCSARSPAVRVGGGQPDLRRPQEPAAPRDRGRRAPRWPSTRSSPTPSGSGGVAAVGDRRSATRAQLDPAAAGLRHVPPGHPQGYQDCFDAFVADTLARHRGRRRPTRSTGCRRFADGVRAALITEAVLRSAATHVAGWTSTPTPAPNRRRSHHEARVPHRLPPEAEPRRHLRLGRGGGLRGPRGGGLARPRRPAVHRHPPGRRRLRRAGGRRRRAALFDRHGLDAARRSRTTTTTSTPTRPSGPRSTSTCTAASTPPPCSAARRSARSSGGTRAARSPRTCATPRRSSRRWSTTPARRA